MSGKTRGAVSAGLVRGDARKRVDAQAQTLEAHHAAAQELAEMIRHCPPKAARR